MAQYTPGPWKADWQFIVAPDPEGVHPDIYIAEIAETDEDGRIAPEEQQLGNRLLIAAAPLLLETLRFVAAWCASDGRTISDIEDAVLHAINQATKAA